MATTPYLPKPLLLLLLILLPLLIKAQITSNTPTTHQLTKFRPTTAIIIAIIISAACLIGLYCYSRTFQYTTSPTLFGSSATTTTTSGLDPAILLSFPVMLYSDVKHHRIGTSSLECAVCINEFDDGDSIRLLPDCSHVFHEECIDAWLASHVTCPVCRAVLDKIDESPPAAAEEQRGEQAVTVVVGVEEERKLMRWRTTGHMAEEDMERYTLRLPERVRNDIFVAGRLRRERSLPAVGGEGSSSGNNSSGRRGMMKKWPSSFFVRSRSVTSFFVGGVRLPENSPAAKHDLLPV